MSDAIKGLKPEILWQYFAEISTIPRCSKHEEAIRAYLIDVAERNNLDHETDATGNVVMRIPAKPGLENAPMITMQAHMDMVCEKNKGTAHDFMTDPIRLVRDGDHLTADGTTLGADNGIGIAAALAFIHSDIQHGPLEILITTDEETGLTGAFNIDPAIVKGRLMLNLDSEEFGYIYVGCAGGANVDMHLPLQFTETAQGSAGLRVTLDGLKGGHSGCDIHLNRGNAALMLNRFLQAAGRGVPLQLAGITSGDKHNAIPREAEADIAIAPGDADKLADLAAAWQADLATELSPDNNLKISIESIDAPQQVMTTLSMESVMNLLQALPHGPLQMSSDIPGLVQTSTNVAVVRTTGEELFVQNSPRSSIDVQIQQVVDQLTAIITLAGGSADNISSYPGWKPDINSPLLETASAVSKELFGEPFAVTAIHAGLECGVIGSRIEGLDKISIGPDIDNPHSPDEYVGIESTEKFFAYLERLIETLAR